MGIAKEDLIKALGSAFDTKEGSPEQTERLVTESDIPAVAIGCELEGCTLVLFDNRKAQYAMAEHIIREHGARRLVYLTGNLTNNSPEGPARLEGFLDACRENNIPSENIRVLEKTWRTSDGTDTARQWIEEGFPFPERSERFRLMVRSVARAALLRFKRGLFGRGLGLAGIEFRPVCRRRES